VRGRCADVSLFALVAGIYDSARGTRRCEADGLIELRVICGCAAADPARGGSGGEAGVAMGVGGGEEEWGRGAGWKSGEEAIRSSGEKGYEWRREESGLRRAAKG